eukprot:TCONS_00073389-protein
MMPFNVLLFSCFLESRNIENLEKYNTAQESMIKLVRSTILSYFVLFLVFVNSQNEDNFVIESPVEDALRVEQKINELPTGHMKQLGEHGKAIEGVITELDYMIGGKDFYEKFARKRKPVIFRGVTRKWKSTRYWNNETYLLENYADVVFDVETGKVYDNALNTRKTMDMKEFLTEYKNHTLYLDSPFPHTPMMQDIELPLMMQCEGRHDKFTSMHLLFSNGNTSSPLHHDGYENFLSSFSGVKVVYIIEPKYGKGLYVEFVEDFPGLSPINPQGVDLVKFPLFKDVPFHKVVINPGDMLYIPQYWYHQVRSYKTPNIATAMWFSLFTIPDAEEFGYRDVLNIADKFAVGVENSPPTLDCLHQNRPLKQINKETDLREFPEAPVNDQEQEINGVTLREEVGDGQPTIFAGSDDTFIYAVDMLTGDLKWKVKTKKDTGSTCLFNQDNTLVYCGADDGYLRAMFIQNGTVYWQYQTSGAIISSVKMDDDGNLYFGCLDHYMYSINKKGEKRWRRFLGNQVWTTPLLIPEIDLLLVGTKVESANDTRANAFALEMTSGNFVWRFKTDGGLVASPRLSPVDATVFLCSTQGTMYELDLLEGKPSWTTSLQTSADEVFWSTPTFSAEGLVFVLTGGGRLVAIDTSTKETKWSLDLHRSKLKDDTKEDDRGSNSSPYYSEVDNILYVGAGFGVVFAINPDNGEIEWQQRVGTGIFFSSPRLSKDGILFIGTTDGFLVAMDTKQNGSILWKLETGGPFVGTALITKGFES